MLQHYKKQLPFINWDEYQSLWKPLELPAKTTLLREGEIARKAYLIEKGCLRMWFNNDGKEITFQFFFENEGVSSIESFKKNQPGFFNLETIEPTLLHYITKDDFNMLLNTYPQLKEYLLDVTIERQIHYMNHFLSLIKDKPIDRYRKLLREKPELIQRVPQHYIATYLGITSVSLSRIRNRI